MRSILSLASCSYPPKIRRPTVVLVGPRLMAKTSTALGQNHATTVIAIQQKQWCQQPHAATIATATKPCLKKGTSSRPSKLHKSPLVKSISETERVRQRIALVKAEIEELEAVNTSSDNDPEEEEEEKPLELAKTLEPGPEVTMSWDEGKELLTKQFQELCAEVDHFEKERKERTLRNLCLINEGRHTIYEFRDAVVTAAFKTGNVPKYFYRMMTDHHVKRHDFLEVMEVGYNGLSPDVQAAISMELDKILDQEFVGPKIVRLHDTILLEMSRKKGLEFRKKRRALLFNSEDTEKGIGQGRSMLPTMPVECEYSAIPIHVRPGVSPLMEVSDLQIGDIVSAVVSQEQRAYGYKTMAVGKRIQALAGDIVDFQGKKVIVPPGHCWLVGDNLEASYDSRQYGAVPLSSIRSKILESTIRACGESATVLDTMTNWIKRKW